MRLKSLRITRQTYGKNQGLMEGDLEVEDPSGEMKVFLTPDRNGTASVPKLGSPGT